MFIILRFLHPPHLQTTANTPIIHILLSYLEDFFLYGDSELDFYCKSFPHAL